MYETLRWIVGGIAVLMIVSGLVLLVSGLPAAASGLWVVALGCLGVVVVSLERQRYRPEEEGRLGGSAFEPTDEVFVDPSTGQRTRVFVDRATGERRYQPER